MAGAARRAVAAPAFRAGLVVGARRHRRGRADRVRAARPRRVRVVAAGDALLDPAVTRDLVTRYVNGRPPVVADPRLTQLTDRERQVLRLVAGGRSNAELADLLTIAESTAKTHVKRILAKIGARDRAQAVAIAYQGGLMSAE